MCQYCERRQDVKFGWNQPKLPYHNQKDISAILSGNVLENEKWDGVIHDYQTCSPQLILTNPGYFEGNGVGTIYIPIKYCPECGRKLGNTQYEKKYSNSSKCESEVFDSEDENGFSDYWEEN